MFIHNGLMIMQTWYS